MDYVSMSWSVDESIEISPFFFFFSFWGCVCQIHGVLNAVSWGILFPMGVIISRYLRTFKSADPAWFYLHVTCQVSAYAIGVAGWGTGMKLGSESKEFQYTGHRNIGITLFCFATVQVNSGLPCLSPVVSCLFPKSSHGFT